MHVEAGCVIQITQGSATLPLGQNDNTNCYTVKLSPNLTLEPQNTDVMSMCLMLKMLAGGASDCQQRTQPDS